MAQRRLNAVPVTVAILLGSLLCAQFGFGLWLSRPVAHAEPLPALPSAKILAAASLGEPIVLGQLLALYLQAFDNQPGISIPFARLNYPRVEQWLERILELDARGQYPMFMATMLYAQVPDAHKQRRMLEFVYRNFFADPQQRWPWLAHAVIMAKHRLHDPRLALRFAQALRESAPDAPDWARQMEIFIHEDLGEYETARILLGGLLASGTITDPNEIHFLQERLEALRNRR